jgi:hypothetical protein
MFRKLASRVKRDIITRVINLATETAGKSILFERHRRALSSTVDYVEENMFQVDSYVSKTELLTKAFQCADVSGDRLVCEFGVWRGDTINHIAKMTTKNIYGFDSFEGLPERWWGVFDQGHFAVAKLPKVGKNVSLIKGWFNKTLPVFLEQHRGLIGFLHIDSDLYSSAKTIFELLEPKLRPGAVIVFDEYFNYPGWKQGEYKAFMEFLEKTGYAFEFIGYNRNEEQVAVILRTKTS